MHTQDLKCGSITWTWGGYYIKYTIDHCLFKYVDPDNKRLYVQLFYMSVVTRCRSCLNV